MARVRKVALRRTTSETDIRVRLNLDGRGRAHVRTGVKPISLDLIISLADNFAPP